MPDELKVARIDEATFMKAQAIVSKYHRIGFPLRFWQNTKHTVDDAAAIRLMEGVCRTDMPPVCFPACVTAPGNLALHGLVLARALCD